MTPTREERRGPPRRWKDLAAIATTALTVGGFLGLIAATGGHFGLTMDDVPQKLARVERGAVSRDSAARARVTQLEGHVATIDDHLTMIDSTLRDARYMQRVQALTSCLVARKVLRDAAPDICATIISRGAP